eukprot:13784241-Alexandrium_andersonii.AAC.1
MSASLVGSEMCIRDRGSRRHYEVPRVNPRGQQAQHHAQDSKLRPLPGHLQRGRAEPHGQPYPDDAPPHSSQRVSTAPL